MAVAAPCLRRWRLCGPKLKGALKRIGRFALEIVKRTDKAKGFEVLPRRWVVERTFAWLGRCRLPRDFEKTIASAEAWILVAISCHTCLGALGWIGSGFTAD